ncbi:MAG TPA: UrcA family protein [Phenylobacterium sp.]|jgi:UrcA family protein|nr:UrcA family protein [Phenylobacterium sp.]
MHRLIVSAAVLVALIGTAAHAEEGTMRVQVGDLNLQHQDGAKVALQRIKSAAAAFCNGEVTSPLEYAQSVRSCRKTMTHKAVGQLGAPLVTALYAPAASTTQLARR